jgi:SAM-dependent methyltransferase
LDLVLAVSIFNHLDEKAQVAWLREVRRVLRPGGIAIITFHGPLLSESLLEGALRARFREKGFVCMQEHSQGWGGVSDVYQSTYHAREYVERIWTRNLALRVYASFGNEHWQDMVVLEKLRSGCVPPPPIAVELPMGRLESPTLLARPAAGKLPFRGWAFYPDGREFSLSLSVDGRPVGDWSPGIPRDRVLMAGERRWGGHLMTRILGAFPHSKDSGFRFDADTRGLAPGRHRWELRVRLADGESPLRFSSGLFEIPA